MRSFDSCTCPTCQSYCQHSPGRFKPGEPEQVADYLGVSLTELFKSKLSITWKYVDGVKVHLLAPAVVGEEGQMTEGKGGQCVFYKQGLCEVHPVRPFECRMVAHGGRLVDDPHLEAARGWMK